MTRESLRSLGFTDESLWCVYLEIFPDDDGPPLAGPDVSELQVRRRKIFDLVCAEAYRR